MSIFSNLFTKVARPPVFFGMKMPDKLAGLLGTNISACTLPPFGILFENSKHDVSRKLFKHELSHWYAAQKMGVGIYYIVFILDYAIMGYKKSILEGEANKYAESPLTDQEQKWWDSYK